MAGEGKPRIVRQPRRVSQPGDGALRITQTRSGIGTKPKHRGTLRALGLHGIGTVNTLPDRPEIRGMLARVPHLVTVEVGVTQQAPAGRASEETR